MFAVTVLERRLRWVGVIVAFIALFYFMGRQLSWTIDDAYITFRYSENVVEGLGPVYNAGERVEGYTCFSWMALLAIAGQAGLPIPMFAKAMGMLFVFGSVALVAFWDKSDPAYGPRDALLAGLGVATTSSFVLWGVSGMETAMFCFCAVSVVFTYVGLLHRQKIDSAIMLGMLGCVLTMTRPNGIVLLTVVLGHALIHRRFLSIRVIAIFVGTFILLYGAYFAWRWSYYGHFLPNTFYAKVGTSGAQLNRGVRYLMAAMPAYAFLLMPVVASWGRDKRPRDDGAPDSAHLLLALVIAHLGYVIGVGGDNFPAHRFIVVVVPFLWLLAVRALPRLAPDTTRRAFLASVVFAYNFAAAAFDPETRVRIARDYVARDGELVGRWIADFTDPDAVIATNSAGALAYFSNRKVVDMLGLNDAEIAHTPVATMGHGKAGHEKGNGYYVSTREPDYVFFGPPKGSSQPMFTGDHQLYELESFKKHYVYEHVKFGDEETLHFFRRLSEEELEEKEREAEERKLKKEREEQKKKQKERAKAKSKAKKRKRRPSPKPDPEAAPSNTPQ